MSDDHAARSRALEQACDFTGAAREALLAKEPARAALLASLGGDAALVARAAEEVVATLAPAEASRAALDLEARGFVAVAAKLFSALGDHARAGAAFAAAGDAIEAAASYERAGNPSAAARALEAALRAHDGDDAARLALGKLLARHGRTEAAVKTLQKLDPKSPERALALPLLSRCLAELGLDDAARTLAEEMKRLGVKEDDASQEGAPLPVDGASGALLFGRYQSVRDVAHTPHARVVEAVDRITNERVAVKLFTSASEEAGRDALLRFEREARALAQLRHPNVVPLRAYLPEGPAIVVPWMGGGSLVDRRSLGPIAPARAVEITRAVLGALGEAHRLGILHRDVKPSNVLFDDAGAARLSDFGAAHLGDLSSTATAGAIGTFAYMSPEQRLGRPATLASDLYGAGVVLAELLTGFTPSAATNGRLDPLPSACHPDLNAAHDAIVAKMLEEDPSKRPADAFEAARLLGSVKWPERAILRDVRAPSSARASERPPMGAERLGPAVLSKTNVDVGERLHDAWLDRDVLVVPSNEASLAAARAFARAGHPALPTVLRVDLERAAFWVAPPRGVALADAARALTPGQVARIEEALRVLHEAGGAHGAVDSAHVFLDEGDVTLAFPAQPSSIEEARARDEAALADLRAAS